MKKLAVLLALLLACMGIARAEGVDGDFEYAIQPNGAAVITGYHGSAAELLIPAELGGCRVSGIGSSAFEDTGSLTRVTIAEGVASIGDYAFRGCAALELVEIPQSVTSLGKNPFAACGALKKIRISPEHPALAIVRGALYDKAQRKLVCYPCAYTAAGYEIPEGTMLIGEAAFYGCESLERVFIPEGVVSMGNAVFYGCTALYDINLPQSLTAFGDDTFRMCASLVSLTVPDSVGYLGAQAFQDCDCLTLAVGRGSAAEAYARENGLDFCYAGSLGWLRG